MIFYQQLQEAYHSSDYGVEDSCVKNLF
ncbi:hypothetical protein THIOSC15_2520027 [uncultured Thiomicrorhabdus sp.]